MDPASLPPQPTTTTITTATTSQLYYSESTNSSPHSRQAETWDEPLPAVPGAKLRLMCSYGGHIIPRPHDKSLCYIGGDTRIVVVDRNSSLVELHSRLSHTLVNGRHFTLKYQLPTEELDSLISVTTDADLENMIEEYDRTMSASPLRPSRLRLFLFLSKPETAASMGCLLADAKSETWFVDALNNASLLFRGLSDSVAADNNIVELDGIPKSDSCTDLENQNEASMSNNNKHPIKNAVQDFHYTIPDSPVIIETTSSFESSVSSPSMANLPPIKVRVEGGHDNARLNDNMFGLEEQFSQINVAPNTQKQDDGLMNVATAVPPHLPTIIGINSAAHGEILGRVISDDEKSDHGAPSGIQKPPLPLQLGPRKTGDGYGLSSPDSRHAGGFNLPSPDSVASDSSIASAASFSKHAINQDATPAISRENRGPPAGIDPKSNIMDPSSLIMQQGQDSAAIPPPQQNQQQQPQFIHASTHYFQHPNAGPVPISPYHPMYAPPSQQPVPQQMDQQFPTYLLPVTQVQPYNFTAQSNIANASVVASSRPPNPTIVPTTAAYKEALPPIYPTKATASSKAEMAASVYRTGAAITPTLVQVPSNQFQQQYFGLSQVSPPSASITPASAASANCEYDYSHPAGPTHDQFYYAQHPVALPSQYQTMTPTTAVLLSQASSQLAAENAMQQAKTSQPL